jgi:hypothetical protein
MDEEVPLESAEPGSDYAAIRDGLISVTPLRFDHTAAEVLGDLEGWFGAEPETVREFTLLQPDGLPPQTPGKTRKR